MRIAVHAIVVPLALFGPAPSADAGQMRRQSVRLPDSCFAPEADEDPEGEPIRVYDFPGDSYELFSSLAGVSRILATVPCDELPQVVAIGGAYSTANVCGRVSRFPGICTPAFPR